MRLLASTSKLVTLFDEAGIPVIVVKGMGLAAQTRAHPLGRPSSDVDLLIPPSEVHNAHSLLHEQGGSLGPGFPVPDDSFLFASLLRLRHEASYVLRGQKVDLHWHLGSVRRILPPTAEVLNRCVSVPVQGFNIPTLPVRDALIHSAVHWRTFGFRKLKYVLDIEALRAQLPASELSTLPVFVKKVLVVSRALRTSTYDGQPTRSVPRGMWFQASHSLASQRVTGPITTRVRLWSLAEQMYETPGLDRLTVPLRVGVGPVVRAYQGIRGS